MDLPSNLVRTFFNLTTSGTANTVTTGQLVASPGVGFRSRLWAFQAVPNNTAQAVVNWRVFVTALVGGNTVLAQSGSNFAQPTILWLPGGLSMGDNNAIGWQAQAALASMTLTLLVFTTTEST